MRIGQIRLIGLAGLAGLLGAGNGWGAETVHYGTHRFVGEVIGAGGSNAVESSSLVVIWQTNNWTPGSSNYLGEFDSYAGYAVEGSDAAWGMYRSVDGATWGVGPTNVAVRLALVQEIGALAGTATISNLVVYGFTDPSTYLRTNDLSKQYLLVRRPQWDREAASKAYVDQAHADWSAFAASTNVYLDGQDLWCNMDYAWTNAIDTNGAVLALTRAGVEVLRIDDGASAYLPIAAYQVTNEMLYIGVATQLVSGTVLLDSSATIAHPRWRRISSQTSQPDATNGMYIVSTAASNVLGFVRAYDYRGLPKVVIHGDLTVSGALAGDGSGLTNLSAGATVELLDCTSAEVVRELTNRAPHVLVKSNANYNALIVANGQTNTVTGALVWIDAQPIGATNWVIRW